MGVLVKVWYLLLFILILSLFFYGNLYVDYSAEDVFNLDGYFKNPQKYGRDNVQVFGNIINIRQNNLYFDLGGLNINVVGSDVKKAVYGETVLFLNFRKDGIIELLDYHNYNYNYLLYIISLFALVVFAIILFMEWKITVRGFKDA